MKNQEKFVTLLELGKRFGVKKATMSYYSQLGLFKPDMIAGKTLLFKERDAINTWKEINKLRKTKTLSQVREIFAKKDDNKKR